jgi:alkylresorcinol/alkylpyrone synthase
MSRIASVRSALPPHRHRQADLAAMTAELCAVPPGRRVLLDRLAGNAGVATRHTALPLADYKRLDGFGPTNDLYITHASALGEEAVRRALSAADVAADQVDLFVVTSVTGLAVPSLDALLMPRLGLRSDVKRVPMFGLGCVAGAAGLARIHDYLLAWPGHTAVLLAVELCSLSIPLVDASVADLVVSSLFGDGAAAAVVRGPGSATGPRPDTDTTNTDAATTTAPRIVATHSEVCPDSADVLGWRLGSDGFRIVLTTELADVVERHLGAVVRAFLAKHDLGVGDVTAWVCHPGGPKVIDAVRDALGLPEEAVGTARESLSEVGNLSSASILHVLEKTLTTRRPAPGTPGLLIGLGPGVSIELVLLEW